MKSIRLRTTLVLILLTVCANAQKVKTGFDKSVDFSKFHTYTWRSDPAEREMTVRKAAIKGEIDYGLKSKGLTPVDEGGDLVLSASGGVGGEAAGGAQGVSVPAYSSILYPTGDMWSGAPVAPGASVVKGSLFMQLVDRSTNKLVWQGTVTEKMDWDDQAKNAKRIRAAIAKLIDEYPPKK